MILTIEVINDGVLDLLSGMERLDLIRVNRPEKNSIDQKEKLSDKFAGALRLSDVDYEAYQNTLQEGRNEWNRNIY